MKKYLNFKRITIILCLILLPASLVFGQTDQNPSHKHMLWKVTSPNGEVNYLTGSKHIMKPSIYPLDNVFQQIFKKADQLVFEVNLDSAQVQVSQLIRKYATLPKGTTLKETVPAHIYTLLKDQLDSLGVPVTRFQHFNPVFVSSAIRGLKLKNAGFTARSGIDIHFFYKAKRAGKPRLALETIAFQMKLLYGHPSSKITKETVKYFLNKANRSVKKVDEIIAAWKHGNAARFDSMYRKVKKENPSFYKVAVLKRNNKWMPEIEQLFNNGKITWVITGVAHMVGKNGIVAMLREDGYQIEQL